MGDCNIIGKQDGVWVCSGDEHQLLQDQEMQEKNFEICEVVFFILFALLLAIILLSNRIVKWRMTRTSTMEGHHQKSKPNHNLYLGTGKSTLPSRIQMFIHLDDCVFRAPIFKSTCPESDTSSWCSLVGSTFDRLLYTSVIDARDNLLSKKPLFLA